MGIVEIVSLVMQLFSTLPGLIKEAESAFSGAPGSGAQKKQLVLDTIGAGVSIANATGKVAVTPEQTTAIQTTAGTLVDSIVSGMNAVKLFAAKKVAADAAAPPNPNAAAGTAQET